MEQITGSPQLYPSGVQGQISSFLTFNCKIMVGEVLHLHICTFYNIFMCMSMYLEVLYCSGRCLQLRSYKRSTLATPPWSTPASATALDVKCTTSGSFTLSAENLEACIMAFVSRFSLVTNSSQYGRGCPAYKITSNLAKAQQVVKTGKAFCKACLSLSFANKKFSAKEICKWV